MDVDIDGSICLNQIASDSARTVELLQGIGQLLEHIAGVLEDIRSRQ